MSSDSSDKKSDSESSSDNTNWEEQSKEKKKKDTKKESSTSEKEPKKSNSSSEKETEPKKKKKKHRKKKTKKEVKEEEEEKEKEKEEEKEEEEKEIKKSIPLSQLGEVLRLFGQKPSKRQIKSLQNKFKEKQTEYLSFNNMLSIANRFKKPESLEVFESHFDFLNPDQDGYVLASELRYTLSSAGEKLTNEEIDELLSMIKIGENGKVKVTEIAQLFLQDEK